MPSFIGQNTRGLIAVNAATAGVTFGGTPGDYDCFKLTGNGFVWEPRNVKELVAEIDVDPRAVVTGGLYYTITVSRVLSYSYCEKIIQLFMGGAISTTGAGSPYSHSIAKADKVLFGATGVEYTDQAAQANEIIRELFTNFAITAISITESPEGYAILTYSGIATALTRTTDQASLTTVQSTEVVSWSHLTPTLNGTATYRLGDIGLDFAAALTEGEFDHAGSTPATLSFVGRSGPRDYGLKIGLRMDADAYTLISDTTAKWTGANSLVWNNGDTSPAEDEREISITLGNLYIDSTSAPTGAWGRQTRDINLKALDGSTAILAIIIKNSRVSI